MSVLLFLVFFLCLVLVQYSEKVVHLERGVLGQVGAVHSVAHLVLTEQSSKRVGAQRSRDFLSLSNPNQLFLCFKCKKLDFSISLTGSYGPQNSLKVPCGSRTSNAMLVPFVSSKTIS